MIQYKFYASLLDKFGGYINSSRIYQQFWGFSENPKLTEEEFEQQQFQSLIDSINRVPMKWEDSEAADKGTAFNEVVDCIIENRKSDKMEIKSDLNSGTINVNYNKRQFSFPISICRDFADYFKGALTQQYCEGVLETKYGSILIYGYIDELMPFKVADIKTTSRYNAYKYRDSWQRLVYPFCLNQNNVMVDVFEFAITDFKNTWTEVYNYVSERDVPLLINHCEQFIEFLELNKHLITDSKVFASEETEITI